MKSVTNTSKGARIVNTMVGMTADGKSKMVVPVVLEPGMTKDLEILDEEDRVFKGMVSSGELVVGEEGTVPARTPEELEARNEISIQARVDAAREEVKTLAQAEIDRLKSEFAAQKQEAYDSGKRDGQSESQTLIEAARQAGYEAGKAEEAATAGDPPPANGADGATGAADADGQPAGSKTRSKNASAA